MSGLTTRDAPAIRRTLRQAAMRMTTLHYSEEELRRAVEPFPAVQSVSADAELPHKLVIRVREHRPVAALVSGDDRRVAVASDGTLLPQERDTRLPAVKVDALPGDGRLGKGAAGCARECRSRGRRTSCARCWNAPTGPATGCAWRSNGGPTLRFGAPIRVRAKWAAAARVLADTPAAGAEYLDLRIPERPSAAYGAGPGGGGAGRGRGRHGHIAGRGGCRGDPGRRRSSAAPPETGPTGASGAAGVAPYRAVASRHA